MKRRPSATWLLVAFAALAALGCGLQVGGLFAPEVGDRNGPDGGASPPADADAGRGADGERPDDGGTTAVSADGGNGGPNGGGSDAGAAIDASACFPAPRACATSADCAEGRCCIAAKAGALTATCAEECGEGRVEACAAPADCHAGVCAPRLCACGATVLACAPIPGACL